MPKAGVLGCQSAAGSHPYVEVGHYPNHNSAVGGRTGDCLEGSHRRRKRLRLRLRFRQRIDPSFHTKVELRPRSRLGWSVIARFETGNA